VSIIVVFITTLNILEESKNLSHGWSRFKEVMDKPKLTGQNLGRVFNLRCVYAFIVLCASFTTTKLANLKLKPQPKQLLVSLPLRCLVLKSGEEG
jgi:hypothetical protein